MFKTRGTVNKSSNITFAYFSAGNCALIAAAVIISINNNLASPFDEPAIYTFFEPKIGDRFSDPDFITHSNATGL